jgi:succinate dehydrogenase / fumarate reductase membrane anchor subunit
MTQNQPTFRTTMNRVRYLGSAHTGTQHAWAMRVTSAALVLLTIAALWLAFSLIGAPYERVRDLFGHRVGPATVAVLFLAVSIYHMKLGMQTIIEDYVHDEAAKTWSLLLNTFFCALIAVAMGVAVLKLSVGA